MNNCLIGQSGGPTAVINASLFGVMDEAMKSPQIDNVYGMLNGIEGFLEDSYMDMSTLSDFDRAALRTTPGAYLGSCRYKLPEALDDPVYAKLFEKFKKLDISYFFYIGGNDSMDTVSKLSRYQDVHGEKIHIVGIPKTIDNDLVLTDHTPGFGSAAKFVASAVREITRDACVYDRESVTIIEIMGRHAGWLTAASVLARQEEDDNPVLIYLPEKNFDEDAFIKDLQTSFNRRKNLVVCVSEGIHDSDGLFVCEHSNDIAVDNFGHKILTGCGKYLENLVKSRLNVKVRSVELNVTQRCTTEYLSNTDLSEAEGAGRFGVIKAIDGMSGFMSAFTRKSNRPYTMEYTTVDVNEVCNMEKTVPDEWITDNGTNVSKALIEYLMPLIQGKATPLVKDGLNYFAYRK